MNNGELLTWIIFHANWKHHRTIGWLWLNGTRLSAGLNIKYHSRNEITKTKATRTKLLSKMGWGSWTTRSLFLEVVPEIQCPENMPERPELKATADLLDLKNFMNPTRESKHLHQILHSTSWGQEDYDRCICKRLASTLVKHVGLFNTGNRSNIKRWAN